jgi:hypothetical protein
LFLCEKIDDAMRQLLASHQDILDAFLPFMLPCIEDLTADVAVETAGLL